MLYFYMLVQGKHILWSPTYWHEIFFLHGVQSVSFNKWHITVAFAKRSQLKCRWLCNLREPFKMNNLQKRDEADEVYSFEYLQCYSCMLPASPANTESICHASLSNYPSVTRLRRWSVIIIQPPALFNTIATAHFCSSILSLWKVLQTVKHKHALNLLSLACNVNDVGISSVITSSKAAFVTVKSIKYWWKM